jgi:transposase
LSFPPRAAASSRAITTDTSIQARHLIENFFSKLKQYRAIATRYDKTARNFLGAIYLAAAVIWLN